MALARTNMTTDAPVCHRVFKVLYTLAKVRGYKTIGAICVHHLFKSLHSHDFHEF
jgi:hypothetical protein